MAKLTINGEQKSFDAPADMPLLWVLRDILGMTGTKFGCGIAQCGACTVHIDGKPVRSCMLPVGAVRDRANCSSSTYRTVSTSTTFGSKALPDSAITTCMASSSAAATCGLTRLATPAK